MELTDNPLTLPLCLPQNTPIEEEAQLALGPLRKGRSPTCHWPNNLIWEAQQTPAILCNIPCVSVWMSVSEPHILGCCTHVNFTISCVPAFCTKIFHSIEDQLSWIPQIFTTACDQQQWKISMKWLHLNPAVSHRLHETNLGIQYTCVHVVIPTALDQLCSEYPH